MSVRIYEIAHRLGIPAKEALERIRGLGIEAKSHSSTVDEPTAERILREIGAATPAVADEAATPSLADEAPAETPAAVTDEAAPPEEPEEAEPAEAGPPVIRMKPPIVVMDLATRLDLKPNQLITELMMMNVLASINQSIESEVAIAVCEHHGVILEVERRERAKPRQPESEPEPESPEAETPAAGETTTAEAPSVEGEVEEAGPGVEPVAPPKPVKVKRRPIEADEGDAEPRPPVVTFMGHVDHGKTSLLDRIRNTQVTASEAGGITQHIGAYQVATSRGVISFIDTPGHEAFTKMRARGAQVTDVAVLVVAAEDGVMPQTLEAINHARAAEVPIIVALNKIDLPQANPDRVRQQLQGVGLTPEEWGGETIVVPVSAQTGEGIDTLLEMILLQSEMMELKSPATGRAEAVVVEAELNQGIGPVATVLVRRGRLKQGDPVLVGPYWGKIRSMTNDQGQPVKAAGPSSPVRIARLSGVPEAGETLYVMASEKDARAQSEALLEALREGELQNQRRVSLEDLYRQMEEEGRINLALVIKADTQGSAEAVADSIRALTSEKIRVDIIHTGVGNITENDAELAGASDALILGFSVRVESGTQKVARHLGVEIRLYEVIYELVDDVRQAMIGRLEPEYRDVVVAHAQVQQVFPLRGGGRVAGSIVSDGAIANDHKVRLLRGSEVVFDGVILSLRRFKDEVREVRAGQDCGIRLENFDEIREGDVIEAYRTEQVASQL